MDELSLDEVAIVKPREWPSDEARVLSRRCTVASCILRGLSPAETALTLEKECYPKASESIVKRDISALEKEWRLQAIEDMDVQVGREIARLAELEKVAWSNENHELVLRIVGQRAKLLGLEAPSRHILIPAVNLYLPQIDRLLVPEIDDGTAVRQPGSLLPDGTTTVVQGM